MTKMFAERLRRAREIRKLTQADLAKLCSLPPSQIAHYESGRREPNLKNLALLSKELFYPIGYLVGVEHTSYSSFYNETKLTNHQRQIVQDIINNFVEERRSPNDYKDR
jgi:transcriptional regulator with XRE-family HTH domain